ncbi:MAG: OmpH family outer membrane protein [Desulfosalsimonadaceae bacterium]
MRLRLCILAWMAMITAALVLPAHGADIAKIGVVDFQRILSESEAGKDIQARIQAKGQGMQGDLQNLKKEIESLEEDLSQRSSVLSKEKRGEMQRELNIKQYDLKSKLQDYKTQIRELESKLMKKMQEQVLSLAEKIGEEEGYLLIIEKSAAVYAPSSIDITDKLIQKYNASYSGLQ